MSLLDGLARIPDMVARAAAMGQKALAITDHGVLYGIIDFYSAAKAAGVKPIIGVEAYMAPRSLTQREPKIDDKNYHLTLLARDETGYRNLLKIVSRAHLEGFYYKPRADRELLAGHADGLICLSGCMSGEVARLLADGQREQAAQTARWYAELFGKERYFLEVQNQRLTGQDALNQQIVALARELDLPLVATNDSHYVRPEDSRAHDILLCIQTNATVNQENRMRLETSEFYLRSGAEMARAFPGLEEALANTVRIAEQADLKLDFDRVLLPRFDLPEGHTPESHLRLLCNEGLRRRYGTVTQEQQQRLDYELGVIERTGYALYFLIVADYVRFARERGILAVPRGSVAGSLAIYTLGICDVDPLQYGLMFERFLHAERIGMPDIDMDFSDDRREEVIRYVQEKYGHDRVAQIITFGTMAARAAVRDVGRALGLSYAEVDRVAKAIPMGATIDEAAAAGELKTMAQDDPKIKELLELARSMEGIARNASTHAAGVVISRDALEEHVPIQKATKGESGVITQWPFGVIEKIGMLKMDFLGLANLTILDQARKIIEARHPEIALDLQSLPMDYDDPSGQPKRTFDMLGEGETTAVFQLESGGMRRCLRGLRPNQISDLLAIVALYRPGPMDNIPAFTAAKNGQAPVTYLHPDLEPILSETYGICVYQDQVLQIVREIAGFSWGEADVLRKAMGKKIAALMAEQQDKFLARTVERGYSRDFAEQLWAIIAPFAGYGFPKGHAAAYAVVSYQTAFLKANYPAEYMAAVLTSEAGNADKVAEAVGECRRLGVDVLPPDVNRSGLDFTLEDGQRGTAIRFGLSGVKNVGHGAIAMLLKARDGAANGPAPAAQHPTAPGGQEAASGARPFADLADFCQRVDLRQLNKRAIESLIKAGAMDSLGERAALLAGLDGAMAVGQQDQRARLAGQQSMFELLGGGADEAAPTHFALPTVAPAERRQRLAWEKEMIGLYISEHPLAGIARALRAATTAITSDLSEELAGQTVTLGGFIASQRLLPTKKGDLMAAVELEDLAGSVEVVVFPRTYAAHRDLLKEDQILLVRGKVDTRDDRPKILCESIELFEAGDIESEPEDDSQAPGEQTAYPLDRSEAEFAESAGTEAERLFGNGTQVSTPRPAAWPAPPTTSGPNGTTHAYAATMAPPGPPAGAADHAAGGTPDSPAYGGDGGDDAFARFPVRDEASSPSAATARIVDLVLERSTRDERDVDRLVRLAELLDRYPGPDRVVLRILRNGRDSTALERADRVDACDELLQEVARELGDDAVRVRIPDGGAAERGGWPAATADEPALALSQ
jgi:DNA polymerase-3 subunit alpha